MHKNLDESTSWGEHWGCERTSGAAAPPLAPLSPILCTSASDTVYRPNPMVWQYVDVVSFAIEALAPI